MFDFLNLAMFFMLDQIKLLTGSYGLAIIAITVLIRVVLWPVNTSQTRSMRKMQELQPKLKALQEKHKDNPQQLQQAMMQFYAENKFNPFAGCLPMLLQLPIFIALYGALNSPEFLTHAGGETFGPVGKLYSTLQTHGGEPFDNTMSVLADDNFETTKRVNVVLTDGKVLERVIPDPHNALIYKPRPMIPGEPISVFLRLDTLGLSTDYLNRIRKVEVPMVNRTTREVEALQLTAQKSPYVDSWLKTEQGKQRVNLGVALLVALYALSTFAYQWLMEKATKAANAGQPDSPQSQAQAGMMKLMPFMFVIMMLFIPIPAGVMLYLLVTMLLMVVQTLWVYWQDGVFKPLPVGDTLATSKPPAENNSHNQVVSIQAKKV